MTWNNGISLMVYESENNTRSTRKKQENIERLIDDLKKQLPEG
jgi:hypothetical protein